jgi:eukaryotic-like serine/threonine-protein kinase
MTSLYGKSGDELPEISGEVGQLLDGKYRLERRIGGGAMGTVWDAVHVGTGGHVAVKLVAKEHAQSREARHRFKLEATAAAKLRSRFVVQVHDTGETADRVPYLAMELLEGETLESRITSAGPLKLPEVLRITSQVARGLARAHALGVVHRDLKPANIFLARSEDDEFGVVAKVLDFGIAKMVDMNQSTSTTRTGTVIGTPQFMSPEQVRGLRSLDHRTDLYALGMVAYTMLTGKLAFHREAFGDLLLSICTEPLPKISDKHERLPVALDAWFERACARDAADRYQSAEALVDGLLQASGLEAGKIGGFVASQPQGTLLTLPRSAPPMIRVEQVDDEAATLQKLAPEEAADTERAPGTVNTSGVLTLGTSTSPRRSRRLSIAVAGAGALIFGATIGVMLFRDGNPPPEPAPVSAAPAAQKPPAPTATTQPTVELAATAPRAAGAPASDAGSASARKEPAQRTAEKRILRSGPPAAPHVRRPEPAKPSADEAKPTKPDLGF